MVTSTRTPFLHTFVCMMTLPIWWTIVSISRFIPSYKQQLERNITQENAINHHHRHRDHVHMCSSCWTDAKRTDERTFALEQKQTLLPILHVAHRSSITNIMRIQGNTPAQNTALAAHDCLQRRRRWQRCTLLVCIALRNDPVRSITEAFV